jgi:hypothetical protein
MAIDKTYRKILRPKKIWEGEHTMYKFNGCGPKCMKSTDKLRKEVAIRIKNQQTPKKSQPATTKPTTK